jgi:deoxyadenosine/deoxycytidine kinase
MIAIAGNMGAGKTSLVDFLSRRYDLVPGYEPNDDNPYLNDFYNDMDRWALHSQLFFLVRKAGLHRDLMARNRPTLLDRTIYEDAEIFARNLHLQGAISKRDFKLYWEFYQQLVSGLRPPDLLIFLHCGLSTVKKRIAIRGRDMEQGVADSYLKRLNRLYCSWIKGYTHSPVIELRTDRIDYLSDAAHQIELLTMVERALDKS